jgi:short-subunit dehydrogenase
MNLRLPPSSALSFITACAVVALPLKKSRIRSSSFDDNAIHLLINSVGFGKSNSPLKSNDLRIVVPVSVNIELSSQIDFGL